MCAIIYVAPVLPPPTPAAVHSIMHHTPLSDYSVSGPARMTTREVSSLPVATSSGPRHHPLSAATAPRVLITTVALIWVGGSDDGEEEGATATTCLSKRNEDMYRFESVWRAIENVRPHISYGNRGNRGYIRETLRNCPFVSRFYRNAKLYLLYIRGYPYPDATMAIAH